MPNFDGNGPLKRGRIIGRGQGPCPQRNEDDRLQTCDAEPDAREKQKTD
jgi:hypothetical protein